MQKFRNIGNAFAGAMAFYLGYTLFRIRRIVVKRQSEIDANWERAVNGTEMSDMQTATTAETLHQPNL